MPDWPADQVERWPLARLVPYAKNARTHSDEQVAQIAASIREWGWTNPVLVDEDGTIVAGHGRVLAARLLGIDDVPVMVARGWTEAQRRAYVLADNKLALNAGWDAEMLAAELTDLGGQFDMTLAGFSLDELTALTARKTAGLTDPDDAPPLEDAAVSQAGDVWILGRHRLACGDCTDARVVASALAGVAPNLMVTDPPYGVEYDATWREGARATGKVLNDDRADWREAWALFGGSVAYVWHAGLKADVVAASLRACRFQLRAQIVWVKPRFVLSRGDYHGQHEPVFYGVREGADEGWSFVPEHEVATYAVGAGKPGRFQGGRKQSTVWFIEHLKNDTGHSTQKPIECMRRPIENNSSPGQAVYEPFCGSGTTIIAGEMTGRPVHAIELSPHYVDVAVRRWQAFTGEAARLEATGATFEGTQNDRTAEADPPETDRRKSRKAAPADV